MLSDSLHAATKTERVPGITGSAEYRSCTGLAMRLIADYSCRAFVMLVLGLMLLIAACSVPGFSRVAAPGNTNNSDSNHGSSFSRLPHRSNAGNHSNNFTNENEPDKTRRVARDFVWGLNQLGQSAARHSNWWRRQLLYLPFPENDFDIELLRELQQAQFRVIESGQNHTANSLLYSVTRLSFETDLPNWQPGSLPESTASQLVASEQQISPYRFEVVVENGYVLSRDYLTAQDQVYPLGPMSLKDLSTGSVRALSIDEQSFNELAPGTAQD